MHKGVALCCKSFYSTPDDRRWIDCEEISSNEEKDMLSCQTETTGLPAYSDSAGTAKKCYCKRVSLYPITRNMVYKKHREIQYSYVSKIDLKIQ